MKISHRLCTAPVLTALCLIHLLVTQPAMADTSTWQRQVSAQLTTPTSEFTVDLPHRFPAAQLTDEGMQVEYRVFVDLPVTPDGPALGVYLRKVSLAATLYVNDHEVGSCAAGPLERQRCLHRPQLFEVPAALWQAGRNELRFVVHMTPKQDNGLGTVQVGPAEALREGEFARRHFLQVVLVQGLTWLSLLLALLCLGVGIVLRRDAVYLWLGLTMLAYAAGNLNWLTTQIIFSPPFFDWFVFSSRFLNAGFLLLTALAFFDRLTPLPRNLMLGYLLAGLVVIAATGSGPAVVGSLYLPIGMFALAVIAGMWRWTWMDIRTHHVIFSLSVSFIMLIAAVDWLRLMGHAPFEGLYLTAYAYGALLLIIGALLLGLLADSLVKSRESEGILERRVAERTAALESALRTITRMESSALKMTENIPVGTFVIETEPSCEPHFSFLSERFLALLGVQREAVMANWRCAFQAFGDAASPEFNWSLAPPNQLLWTGETRLRGRQRAFTLESSPRRLNDGRLLYEGVLIEVTEQRDAERALIAAKERAETLEQAKSDFLAKMSHEIRTPLSAVLGFTELLGKMPGPNRQRDMVERIDSAGKTLLGLVNDILDAAKIEAGQLRIHVAAFDLDALLNKLLRLYEPGAGKRNNTLDLHGPEWPEGCSPTVLGDALRIEQVLGNLLSNAIKFTERGRITLRVLASRLEDQRLLLRFEVSDTGTGIHPQALPRMFAPFSQAEEGIGRHYGGTGLGLSISQRIVELMGGHIGASSELGAGSRFWFALKLPALPSLPGDDDEPLPDHSAVAREAWRLTGLRILVTDDSEMMRVLISDMLESEGAHVEAVENGQQALDALHRQGQGFDIVLLDVQMPVMDGISTLREIRADPALNQQPVVAITAGLLGTEGETLRKLGVRSLLSKPIKIDPLVSACRMAVATSPESLGTPENS